MNDKNEILNGYPFELKTQSIENVATNQTNHES